MIDKQTFIQQMKNQAIPQLEIAKAKYTRLILIYIKIPLHILHHFFHQKIYMLFVQ